MLYIIKVTSENKISFNINVDVNDEENKLIIEISTDGYVMSGISIPVNPSDMVLLGNWLLYNSNNYINNMISTHCIYFNISNGGISIFLSKNNLCIEATDYDVRTNYMKIPISVEHLKLIGNNLIAQSKKVEFKDMLIYGFTEEINHEYNNSVNK